MLLSSEIDMFFSEIGKHPMCVLGRKNTQYNVSLQGRMHPEKCLSQGRGMGL